MFILIQLSNYLNPINRMRSDVATLAVHHADLQKAASMQAMLGTFFVKIADIFGHKMQNHIWESATGNF